MIIHFQVVFIIYQNACKQFFLFIDLFSFYSNNDKFNKNMLLMRNGGGESKFQSH